MSRLSKETKCDLLLEFFIYPGTRRSVQHTLEYTGIKNYNSLKALFTYIRKAPHIPEGHRIDIRIKDGICQRVC